jgi:hypothetical protein
MIEYSQYERGRASMMATVSWRARARELVYGVEAREVVLDAEIGR